MWTMKVVLVFLCLSCTLTYVPCIVKSNRTAKRGADENILTSESKRGICCSRPEWCICKCISEHILCISGYISRWQPLFGWLSILQLVYIHNRYNVFSQLRAARERDKMFSIVLDHVSVCESHIRVLRLHKDPAGTNSTRISSKMCATRWFAQRFGAICLCTSHITIVNY